MRFGYFHIGFVSAVYPESATVRVLCPDLENFVTAPLPVLQPATEAAQVYCLPGVGERVACLFLGSGTEDGVVLGALYDEDTTPPLTGPVVYTRFGNDAIVIYHKETKRMLISTAGVVEIAGAGGVTLTGDVQITGALTVTGDVTGAGISLATHKHTEQGDGNPTSAPIVGGL